MPRTKWKRPKNAGKLFLAQGKVEAQGLHPKCERCPIMESCKNILYDAKGMIYIFCADDPRERRE